MKIFEHLVKGMVIVSIPLTVVILAKTSFSKPSLTTQPGTVSAAITTTVLNDDQTLRRLQKEDYKSTTINKALQIKVGEELRRALNETKAEQGLVAVVETQTGIIRSVLTMNNRDTNDQGEKAVADLSLQPWEPGSVMKPFVIATALNEGTVTMASTYSYEGSTVVQNRTIVDSLSFNETDMRIQDILSRSLNTGTVAVLESLGDDKIDVKARKKFYDYLTQRFGFGQVSGPGMVGETAGYVRPPVGGNDLEFRYATSSFGTGIVVTPLQLVAAYSALINGGELYTPMPSLELGEGGSERNGVITKEVSSNMKDILVVTLKENLGTVLSSRYVVGGKSGTALLPAGDIYEVGKESGTYVGFIGKDKPEYTILARLDDPVTESYASVEASQLWKQIVKTVVDLGLLR